MKSTEASSSGSDTKVVGSHTQLKIWLWSRVYVFHHLVMMKLLNLHQHSATMGWWMKFGSIIILLNKFSQLL
jgi:hypothetical protein